MINQSSLQKAYKRTYAIVVFYEWIELHDKIIVQGQNYAILAQKHLVPKDQLILSLLLIIQRILKNIRCDNWGQWNASIGSKIEAMSH